MYWSKERFNKFKKKEILKEKIIVKYGLSLNDGKWYGNEI